MSWSQRKTSTLQKTIKSSRGQWQFQKCASIARNNCHLCPQGRRRTTKSKTWPKLPNPTRKSLQLSVMLSKFQQWMMRLNNTAWRQPKMRFTPWVGLSLRTTGWRNRILLPTITRSIAWIRILCSWRTASLRWMMLRIWWERPTQLSSTHRRCQATSGLTRMFEQWTRKAVAYRTLARKSTTTLACSIEIAAQQRLPML